jgi:hypothetical protein
MCLQIAAPIQPGRLHPPSKWSLLVTASKREIHPYRRGSNGVLLMGHEIAGPVICQYFPHERITPADLPSKLEIQKPPVNHEVGLLFEAVLQHLCVGLPAGCRSPRSHRITLLEELGRLRGVHVPILILFVSLLAVGT